MTGWSKVEDLPGRTEIPIQSGRNLFLFTDYKWEYR